jgi:hypothetical protein
MCDRTLGARLHAFYEGAELVVALQPLRVLQGEVPPWVKEWVLGWAREHMGEVNCQVAMALACGRGVEAPGGVRWAQAVRV